MIFTYIIHPKYKKEINKSCKRNPVLRKILESKMNEIIQNPSHYKQLKYELAGERRVHILKSFVLKFEIDNIKKVVTFLAFEHHDKAYKFN